MIIEMRTYTLRPGSVAEAEKRQGCSTLSTDAPLKKRIDSGESGSVSVLIERAGLIAAENVVAKAADPGEDTGVMADAGLVLQEGDVARVVQLVLDMPVAPDHG